MVTRVCVLFAFLLALPARSQVEPPATGGAIVSLDDPRMMMPPPVSGMPYPNKAAEEESSFVSAGVTAHVAYLDNLLPGTTAVPVNDMTYSVLPTFRLESGTVRQKATVTYSPSFIFYEPTSNLNGVDQSASAVYEYRLSPSLAVSLQNYFGRTSNFFDQSYLFSPGGVTGSTQLPTATIIAPFTEQMTENGTGLMSYQFARNAMVGGGGTGSVFNLPNGSQTTNLYNSYSEGGMAFYDRRLSRGQYIGFVYQYQRLIVTPPNTQSEAQIQTLLPFYTVYFSPTFSLSASIGAQSANVTETGSPNTSLWLPSADVSLGWQGNHGNFAASYARTVSSGEGLVGAYNTNSVKMDGGWKFAGTWIADLTGSYANIKNATPYLLSTFYQGGHSISGGCLLKHPVGEHLDLGIGYVRLHELYSGIPVIAADPDSNEEYVTVSYEFRKLLGR